MPFELHNGSYAAYKEWLQKDGTIKNKRCMFKTLKGVKEAVDIYYQTNTIPITISVGFLEHSSALAREGYVAPMFATAYMFGRYNNRPPSVSLPMRTLENAFNDYCSYYPAARNLFQ